MKRKIVENNFYEGLYTEEIYDEEGRCISETYPVDKDGECPDGYELEITTFEYEYDDGNHTPSRSRHRGYGPGCFWTEWEEY